MARQKEKEHYRLPYDNNGAQGLGHEQPAEETWVGLCPPSPICPEPLNTDIGTHPRSRDVMRQGSVF